MESLLTRLTPVLHLTRITMAFAAVANVWLVILWTRAAEPETHAATGVLADPEFPLLVLLAGGTAMAVGLFAFGMALNDTIDLRRDRALHPSRPIPSGKMTVEAALGWVVGSLILALLGAAVLGLSSVVMCLGTAAAIFFYAGALRFIPAAGLVLLCLIYGAHMMAANVNLVFVWPVWLSMTHALVVGVVTHKLSGTPPTLSLRHILIALTGYVFWSAVLLGVGWYRAGALWPSWVPIGAALWPTGLVLMFALFSFRKVSTGASGQIRAEKLHRYGALWLALYASAWLVGAGFRKEGFFLAMLALSGVVGMTIIRELFSLIEHPIGYRR